MSPSRRAPWWPWAVMGAVLAGALLVGAVGERPPATAAEQVSEIGQGIRCPSCVGESVAQSDSDVAKQIRVEIAQRLQQGQSTEEIRAYFAGRYGEGVLLTPPSSGLAGLVWVLPVVVLVLAGAGLVVAFRRWGRDGGRHATDEDRALVASALSTGPDGAPTGDGPGGGS